MPTGFLCRPGLHLLILGALCSACSLLYEADMQCQRDSDCVKLAADVTALSGSYCLDHVCVVPTGEARACDTHSDCVSAASGDPALCQDGRCVSLLHGECTQVLGSDALTTNDDIIVLGAFSPLNNALPSEETELRNYQLALDEIMANTRGAVGYLDYNERPFIFVVCRSEDPSMLDESVDHLTKTLKVPAIISNLQAETLKTQMTRMIGEGTNTMVLSALSSDPGLLSLSDHGRMWHLLGTPGDLVPGYVRLIEEQISSLATEEARVLMVVNDVLAMGEIADAVEEVLSINGATVAEAANANQYQRIAIESLALHPDNPNTSELSQWLGGLLPNVIVYLAGPEVIDTGIASIEADWQAMGYAEPPRYVLSHHLFNQAGVLEALGSAEGYEERMYGINYAGSEDRTLYEGYLRRFKAKYPEAYQEEYENFYDAAHYAMLSVIGAARATATEDITGDLVVKGFKRLIDADYGVPLDLKPETLSTVSSGILEADAESTIYLTGTLGAPDFSADGGRHYRPALWCIDGSGASATFSSGGVLYDEETDAFEAGLSACHGGTQ